MKLAEAFARKTYGPRFGEEQFTKAKKDLTPHLKRATLAALRDIWLDLHDKGEVNQKYFDWVETLIAEGHLADVIVDFLDFRAEAPELAKYIEAEFN